MAKIRTFDLMVDSQLFGESLSDFVKAHLSQLKGYKLGELANLWKLAKARARAILRA
jgi:hypothetical protein